MLYRPLFDPNDVARLTQAVKAVAITFDPSVEFIEAAIKGYMLVHSVTSKQAVDDLVAVHVALYEAKNETQESNDNTRDN